MALRMHITYLQRTREEGEDGFPVRHHLHAEDERIHEIPLFAELVERFGRCEGKVYRNPSGTEAIHCGYLFAKRERWYDQSIGWDDPRQFYTAETWVTFERVTIEPVNLASKDR